MSSDEKSEKRKSLSLHPLKPEEALSVFMAVDPEEYAKANLRKAKLTVDLSPLKRSIDELELELEGDVSRELVDSILSIFESGNEVVSLNRKTTGRAGEVGFTLDLSKRLRELLAALRTSKVH